jgi:hypothetical protein
MPLAAAAVDSETAAVQWKDYQAQAPKTIVELQPFRSTERAEFQMPGDRGTATLIDLNPRVNAWFLLTLRFGAGGAAARRAEAGLERNGRGTSDYRRRPRP